MVFQYGPIVCTVHKYIYIYIYIYTVYIYIWREKEIEREEGKKLQDKYRFKKMAE